MESDPKKPFENLIDLDVSVIEQIADMQLAHLRAMSMQGPLDFDKIKVLEILSKVKNTEVVTRTGPKEDPKKAKSRKLQELAAESSQPKLVEAPKDEDKEKVSVS